MRAANLSFAFEANDFFIHTHFGGLSSLEACKAVIAAGVRLVIEGDEVWLHAGKRPLRRLSEAQNDDFGRWPGGVDRTSFAAFVDGLMPQDAFMAALPAGDPPPLVWWGITESEVTPSGLHLRIARTETSAEVRSDKLASG